MEELQDGLDAGRFTSVDLIMDLFAVRFQLLSFFQKKLETAMNYKHICANQPIQP